MKNDEKLWEICKEIYRKMYKEARPSASFDELCETRKHDKFFEDYYLNDERQCEIIAEICKKHKCTKNETDRISTEVHLGCSPSTNSKAGLMRQTK